MINKYINQYNTYRPDFANENTNHLPMSLYALYKIGGKEVDLDNFTKIYLSQHQFQRLGEVKVEVNHSNWETFLGHREHYEAYKVFFENEVKRLNKAELISIYLPILLNGISSEAFHCLIKFSFAIESENQEELANSLAYWCATFLTIPNFSKKEYKNLVGINRTDLILENLENSTIFNSKEFSGNNISQKIKEVFEDNLFLKYATVPNFSIAENLNYLRNSVLKIHLLKWNFTSLHLVTSLHSLRIIENYITNKNQLYQIYWISVLASVVTINSSKSAAKTATLCYSTDDWNSILKKAISSMNDHVIKLVYSCFEEYTLTGNYLYQIVASKTVEQTNNW